MITDPPPDRIQWHEGMLLSPQHFQQEAARVDALVAWHTLASSPYSWGIRKLELDQSLLVAGSPVEGQHEQRQDPEHWPEHDPNESWCHSLPTQQKQ